MLIRLFSISFFISSVFAKPLQLEDGDVVAFIGGTDLVRMQKEGIMHIRIKNYSISQLLKESCNVLTIEFYSSEGRHPRQTHLPSYSPTSSGLS